MRSAMSTWIVAAWPVVAVPSSALPQTPPTVPPSPAAGQPAAAEADLTDVWLVIYNVQPARTADFEAVAMRVREAMKQSTVPRRRRQAEGLAIHRSALPNPEGNVVYFVQVPTERTSDTDRTGLDVLIDAVLPAEATALRTKLETTLDARNPTGNTLMLAIR